MKKVCYLLMVFVNLARAQSTPNYSVYGVFCVSQTKYYDAAFSNLITNNGVAAYFTYSPAVQVF